jgi:hypothetical protein
MAKVPPALRRHRRRRSHRHREQEHIGQIIGEGQIQSDRAGERELGEEEREECGREALNMGARAELRLLLESLTQGK